MKKTIVSILALGLLIVSCSNDDDAGDSFKRVTYTLIEVNVENPTDGNGDGIANRNEMLETDCYENTQLVLESPTEFYNVDGKFGYLDTGLQLSVSCQSDGYNGAYEFVDNKLMLKSDEKGVETFEITGDKLKVSYQWTFFDGDLEKKAELVYQKQ